MKKKFVAVVAILLISCSVRICAAAALIDSNVGNVIDGLVRMGSQFNISFWGKEYYSYQGLSRCELHFGDSADNLIRFRLDGIYNVQRALVSFPDSSSTDGGRVLGAILIMAGVDKNDYATFTKKFVQDLMEKALEDPYNPNPYFHRRYEVWASETRRNITVDFEWKNSFQDYYIYAE